MTAPASLDPAGTDLVANTRAALSRPVADSAESEHLFAALGAVPLRVTDAVHTRGASAERALEGTRLALELQSLLRDHVRLTRSEALARVQEVLASLARDSRPAELLASAPAALSSACGFDRVLISRVEGSSWVPHVLHAARGGSPELTELLADVRIPLKAGLVETDVVRRRTTSIVQDAAHDPRTYRPLIDTAGVGSYVVAPIVVADKVVGLIHADHADAGDDGARRLTSTDRDLVKLFADCFGRAYESAVIAERVDTQREHLRRAFSSTELAGPALDPAVIRFSRSASSALAPVAMAEERHQGLTHREQEILALVATGATNLQIAEQLVLADSTVKSHVKRILRKLNAANRAEAASLYLRGTSRTGISG